MTGTSIYKSEQGERAVREAYDALLARWPVPWRSVETSTRQGRTHVICSGPAEGPALVLIHGAASNALMWMGDVERFARTHRVFAVDVIGEPGRSAPSRPPWGGSAYAEWLEEVLDGLGLGNVRLVGLSQGGWIALDYATRRPERVERLVLLSPAGVVRDRITFLLRALPRLALGRRGARSLNRIVAGPQPMHPDALAFMDLIIAHLRPRLDPAPLFDDAALSRLSMPVLFLGGDQDAIRNCAAIARRLAAHVPRLHAAVLPGVGHAVVHVGDRVMPFLEAAEAAA